jgi:PPOX class probable F420-dependent enzyme
MTPEEIIRYLDGAPARKVGVVGTLRADGSPHLVPVWFWYDGVAVFIWTGEDRAWVHHLRRDPRVAFSVQDQTEPYAAVLMRGTAEVLPADPRVIREIVAGYVPPAEIAAYIEIWKELQLIVSIAPAAIRAWGRGY